MYSLLIKFHLFCQPRSPLCIKSFEELSLNGSRSELPYDHILHDLHVSLLLLPPFLELFLDLLAIDLELVDFVILEGLLYELPIDIMELHMVMPTAPFNCLQFVELYHLEHSVPLEHVSSRHIHQVIAQIHSISDWNFQVTVLPERRL